MVFLLMDELSLFALAGTTSSAAQTPSDPVVAAPTPPDGDDFAAALKAAAAAPAQHDSDETVGAAAETALPTEGLPAPAEQRIETTDTQLVWAVDDAGFIAADRNLPFAALPAPSTVNTVADDSQALNDDPSQFLEALPAAETATLISTPEIAASIVSGSSNTGTAPTETQLLAPDAVSVSGTRDVELVGAENSDVRKTALAAATHIPGTLLEPLQTQQQHVTSGAGDAQVALSSGAPEPSIDVPQHERQLPATSAGHIPSGLTPASVGVPAVPHAPTDSAAVVPTPSTEPGPSVLSVPTAPTPRTERIPTVLTLPNVSGRPLTDRVSVIPNAATQAIPGSTSQAIPSSADPGVPQIPPTLEAGVPAVQAVSTEPVAAVPTSSTEHAATVLTPLNGAVPTGKTARIPSILKTSTEPPTTLAPPPSASEVSGITRPVNVTADLLSADVTTTTSIVNEVLQAKSPEVPMAPSMAEADITTIVLPSSAGDSGYSPRVNVPQPLTSQVLVAMAQNLSVVREQSSGTLTLRLDPPELGQMEVQFRQSEQGVELRLAARVPETLQMLLSRGDEISRALSTMDLDFSKLEIAGDDGFRGGGESAESEHSSSQQSESEQQNQGPGLDQDSEGDDQGDKPGRIHQSSQFRRRSRIRA
jgi:flagellar hook-length control protein FliK